MVKYHSDSLRVHLMKDRSDDPLHHERTLLKRSYISITTNATTVTSSSSVSSSSSTSSTTTATTTTACATPAAAT